MSICYHIWLWHKTRTHPFSTSIGINANARRFWVPAMLKDIEKKNILVAQSLRNLIMGSTLMATTSILLSAGLAAVISSTYSVKKPLDDITLGRWLKNFQEKPIWKLHHEFSARFRSVPRRNSWSGLIPSRWLKNFQEKPIWKLHHEFSARFRSVPRRNSWSGLIPSVFSRGNCVLFPTRITYGAHGEFMVALKYVTLLTIFLFSFFCHSLSIMFLNELAILICTPQEALSKSMVTPEYLNEILEKGSILNTVGNRIFYLALPLLLWIFGPILVLLCFMAMLPVFYNLDFVVCWSSSNHGKSNMIIINGKSDNNDYL
ncbi:hypothetical protein Ahy_A05g023832 [Arachis hypogaea]|uniref:Uncharacterized protein n=1 Tax=Arachis hypogaea TaxID=3818 RepID=A0A445D4L7_ARAHY|nr:hypothetical protein Ahy_A05g023832 [Arachis hypogaea]